MTNEKHINEPNHTNANIDAGADASKFRENTAPDASQSDMPNQKGFQSEHLTAPQAADALAGKGAATSAITNAVPNTSIKNSGSPDAANPEKRVSIFRAILTWILILVAAMSAAWLVRSYVLTPYEIPSGSMEHTLEIGDRVFAERVSYLFTEPKQGDIITFMDPETEDKKVHRTLIKRVVATAGQTVDLIDGTLYVDGAPQTQDYIVGNSYELPEQSPDADLEFPFTVPDGYVFAMGDNRENSMDSRYFGAVPVDTIYGHAVMTYWPFEHFKLLS